MYPALVEVPLATRQRLNPRVIEVHRITHGIVTGALLLAALLTSNVAAVAGAAWWQAGAFVVLSVVGAWLLWRLGRRWAQTSYDHTSYVVSPDGLEIARGVFWRRTIRVPRSRIQHTDVTQGPLQRSYQLSTLVLYTAGAEHARIALDGLAFDTALSLRADLLRADNPEAAPPTPGPDDAPATPIFSETVDEPRS